MTREDAVTILAGADHAIFDDKETQDIFKAFGITDVPTPKIKDTRSEFKGAYIPWSGGEGTYALAADAAWVATTICNRLGIGYSDYFGRGSQLAECVKRLREHEVTVNVSPRRDKEGNWTTN
jgi:hypothetical protein